MKNRDRLATAALVVAIGTLIGLGAWQLERRSEKQALVDTIAARTTAPVIELTGLPDDTAALDYRRVRLEGHFDHLQQMRLRARTFEGQPGEHWVTPFVTADGWTVLVDRGWVPPGFVAYLEIDGTTTIEGIARLAGEAGWFTPDNEPGTNSWYWIDLQAMAASAGLETVAPFYIEASRRASEIPPFGGQTRISLPRNHLQYALTWFGLAAVFAVAGTVYLVRAKRKD